MRAGARVLADDMRKAINFELVRRLPDVANKSEDVQAELEAYIHTIPQVLESYLTEEAAAAGSADRLELADNLFADYPEEHIEPLAAFLTTEPGQFLIETVLTEKIRGERLSEADLSQDDRDRVLASRESIDAFFDTEAGVAFMNRWDALLHQLEGDLRDLVISSPKVVAYLLDSCEIIDITCETIRDPRLTILTPNPNVDATPGTP